MRISRWTPEARSLLCICRASFLMTFATGGAPHASSWHTPLFLPGKWHGCRSLGGIQLCALCAKSLQSCLTLYDPKDFSPPASSVHGILQAGKLEWVAMPSSRGSFQPLSLMSPALEGGFFTNSAAWEYISWGHKELDTT